MAPGAPGCCAVALDIPSIRALLIGRCEPSQPPLAALDFLPVLGFLLNVPIGPALIVAGDGRFGMSGHRLLRQTHIDRIAASRAAPAAGPGQQGVGLIGFGRRHEVHGCRAIGAGDKISRVDQVGLGASGVVPEGGVQLLVITEATAALLVGEGFEAAGAIAEGLPWLVCGWWSMSE